MFDSRELTSRLIRKLPTYSSPKSTFCPKWVVGINVCLKEGVGGQSPRNLNWPDVFCQTALPRWKWNGTFYYYVVIIAAGHQPAADHIECFHMTSRRPYWCPKTMKRRPCWCPKLVLWEMNSFLMQMISFVPKHLHRCWPREWKHSILERFEIFCSMVQWFSMVPWFDGHRDCSAVQSAVCLSKYLAVAPVFPLGATRHFVLLSCQICAEIVV